MSEPLSMSLPFARRKSLDAEHNELRRVRRPLTRGSSNMAGSVPFVSARNTEFRNGRGTPRVSNAAFW